MRANGGTKGFAVNSRLWRLAQVVLVLILVAVITSRIHQDWATIRSSPAEFDIRIGWLMLSVLSTWLMYAALIEGWRRVASGWNATLSWIRAARIWTLSGLAALIPGRVWGFAGMAMMSERAGVGAGAAVGAAVIMQVLAIGTGVGVAALALGPALGSYRAGAGIGLTLLGSVTLLSLLLLTDQRVVNLLWRVSRRTGPAPTAPRWPILLESGLINTVAWVGYGVALWALARGILPSANLPLRVAIGTFAISYIAGYLAFFTPGGLGVRELLLVGLLSPTIGAQSAVGLSLASRLVTLLNQVGAAVPFLILRESTSDGK